MAKPTIAAMDGSDWAQMREQVAHVTTMLKKRYNATLDQSLADLQLLQRAFDDEVYDVVTDKDQIRGLGAAFGNVVSKQLNFEWMAEDDGRNREPVLRLKTNSKLVINPGYTLLRQAEAGEKIDLPGLYKNIQADVKRSSLI
ncbi:MAG: DUF3806 domain-containing protein [Polyangiales bacterium]